MRKIIVIEFITLDGVIQSPGSPDEDPSGGFSLGGWIGRYSDATSAQIIKGQMQRPFDLLLGRKTFDIWAAYWPDHGDIWPGVNRATKHVVTTTLDAARWQPAVLHRGDVPDEVRRLKDQNGPDLQVYGSSELVQTLVQHDLVDELWLRIHPVVLGQGKRLFAPGTPPLGFRLAKSVVTSTGVIFADYVRDR